MCCGLKSGNLNRRGKDVSIGSGGMGTLIRIMEWKPEGKEMYERRVMGVGT